MFSAAVTIMLHGTMCAIAGVVFICISNSERDILGFIPQWVERKYTPNSKIYKLVTCPCCMAGQFAFWAGMPYLFKTGLLVYLCTIFAAIYLTPFAQYLHRKVNE